MRIIRAYSSATLGALAMALIFSATGLKGQDAAQAAKPSKAPAGNAEKGKQIFTKDGCYECHGREGQGGVAPRIGPNPVSLDAMLRYIRKPLAAMPPYTAKVISDEEVADIHAYLETRPHPQAVKNIPLLNK